MRSRLVVVTLLVALLALPLLAPRARAQNALVVSVWGGNWKDTVEKVDRQGLHGEDRHPGGVRGGRHHRPPRQGARGQGQPARRPELHDHARGAALHLRRALREARHGEAAQRARRSPRRRSAATTTSGSWAYVYTVVYRPDLVKEEITKWSDLWKPSLKGKIAHAGLRPLAHHHHRRADGGRQRGQLAEGRGQAQAAQGLGGRVLLDRRAEPGPHEDGPGAGAGDALGQRLPPPGAGHRRQGRAADRLSRHRRHRHDGGDGRHARRRTPRTSSSTWRCRRRSRTELVQGLRAGPGEPGRDGARQPQGPAGHLHERRPSGRSAATS